MEKYKNILVVDDDPVSNYICNLLLSKYRIAQNIYITEDIESAIYAFSKLMVHETLFPDLILLDIKMPKKDGFSFMQQFNDQFQLFRDNTQICVLTNSISGEDFKKMKILGIDYWVSKPLKKEIILNLSNLITN